MSSTYPRIDWLMLLAYFLPQNHWHNCSPSPTTLVVTPPSKILNIDHLKKLYLLQIHRISGNVPSDIDNMTEMMDLDMSFISLHGKSLTSLVCSMTFDLLACMRLTSMVLSPQIWTTRIRSNTSPLNYCSLLYSFYDLLGTSPLVVGFTCIVIFMLKGLTK